METEQQPPSQQSPPRVARYGSWDTTIDAKRRLVLPAEVRNAMDPQRDGTAFFVFVGKNSKVWFYPEWPFHREMANNQMGLNHSENDLTLNLAVFGGAFRRDWDKQGRVILPDAFLVEGAKMADLPLEVTLVGAGDHYQLWRTPDWRSYAVDLAKNRTAVFAKGTPNPT
jgi:DNA-binding transcriptional regulator/RsmH inhibitor MraZ